MGKTRQNTENACTNYSGQMQATIDSTEDFRVQEALYQPRPAMSPCSKELIGKKPC
jgi:hypothetical protein